MDSVKSTNWPCGEIKTIKYKQRNSIKGHFKHYYHITASNFQSDIPIILNLIHTIIYHIFYF